MRGQFRLLVAEDSSLDTLLLQRAFLEAGISIPLNFVADGEEAIEYLSGTGPYQDREAYPVPTILLLDLKMPRRDGFEVLGWIRRQPFLRRLVVVIFTSSDLDVDVNRAYDLGANSYLSKTDLGSLPGLLETWDDYWRKQNQFGDCVGNSEVKS
jgi:CheY-like chemotaxis protein